MVFENNAKGMIDKLIYMNEASVNRDYVIAQLDGIAMMEGEEREEAIREYYMALYKQVFRDAIKHREAAANDLSLLKEDQQLHTMSAQIVFNDLTKTLNTYFAEKEITPCEGKPFFGVDPEVIRDTIYGVCNEFKAIDTLKTAGRERKIDLLNEMRTNLDSLADNGYQYGTNGGTSDTMIEEMFVMHEERAAQYAKAGFRWKLRHPIQAIKTSWFLRKTEKDLKKIGFNKATHGVAVKERCEKEPNSILKQQMMLAKDNCKNMQEEIKQAEWRKNNPVLTVARDKFNKAQAYYEDKEHPERSFRNEVAHILDKYKLDPEKDKDFSKVDLSFKTAAEDFDFTRDTSSLEGQKDSRFFELCKAFTDARLKNNEPIHIKEIFKDALDYMEIELKTFSVAYERDEFKPLVSNGLIPAEKRLTAIQNRLLNMTKDKLAPEEVERIQNDIREFNNEQVKSIQGEEKPLDAGNGKEQLSISELKEVVTSSEVSDRIKEEPTVTKEAIKQA